MENGYIYAYLFMHIASKLISFKFSWNNLLLYYVLLLILVFQKQPADKYYPFKGQLQYTKKHWQSVQKSTQASKYYWKQSSWDTTIKEKGNANYVGEL